MARRHTKRPRRSSATIGVGLAVASALAALCGCGHPASVHECEEIVETITRLELAERGVAKDSQAVSEEIESTKSAMHDRMMKECVGKRVTNNAMRCVRQSTNSKKVEKCFD